jgi:hypothetical protein
MTAEWIKIIAGWVVGFATAYVVQLLSLAWQECIGRKRLRESLSREITSIYAELRGLLPHLRFMASNASGRENSPANFPAIVRAPCFEAAKSSPLFWRLEDAFDIIKVHGSANFGFLASLTPAEACSAPQHVELVLRGIESMVDAKKLRSPDLEAAVAGRAAEE